ncbi:MAG: 1-acyl-sn-glycerol-3-phosphate acyltransferase [Gemmatimonadaceae bacterium]|nr:1-acyl-sn-glycerol-3-phosphate acyltransferase [Gemmatimonadaceae bacterium]
MLGTLLNWWAWVETVSVVILGTPVVALVWLFTAPFDKGRYAAGRAFRLVGVTAMRLNGLWHFRVRGALTDPRRPYVVVANHESYADVFLISCFPWEMKWLSKDTMFKIPCMGWMMQMAGDIKLVRGDRDSTLNAIAQCRDRLTKKVSVMIFPEGTRSKTQEMLPFKDGAFRLAIESGAPILPIAVAGTRNAMAKGTFRFLRARALAQVLEPIDTAGMTLGDIPRLKQLARDRIDVGRRALAAELGIAMAPPAATSVAAPT